MHILGSDVLIDLWIVSFAVIGNPTRCSLRKRLICSKTDHMHALVGCRPSGASAGLWSGPTSQMRADVNLSAYLLASSSAMKIKHPPVCWPSWVESLSLEQGRKKSPPLTNFKLQSFKAFCLNPHGVARFVLPQFRQTWMNSFGGWKDSWI